MLYNIIPLGFKSPEWDDIV